MATYGIAIKDTTEDQFMATEASHVDTEALRQQLTEIRDSLSPVLEETGAPFRLSEMEIALTLDARGKVLFIGEAGVEASITLTFSRPDGK